MTRVGDTRPTSSRSRLTASTSCCACWATDLGQLSQGPRATFSAHGPLPPCHRRNHPRGLLLTYYPDPEAEALLTRTVEYVITDLPWSRVNIARFQIDRSVQRLHGGRRLDANPSPIPAPAQIPMIRRIKR